MTSALKSPSFRRLAAALAASQIGDWLYNVALAMLVFERTGSAAWVALTTAARIVPIIALGAVGGVVADRFDRRRVMIASDLVRMGVMGALGARRAQRAADRAGAAAGRRRDRRGEPVSARRRGHHAAPGRRRRAPRRERAALGHRRRRDRRRPGRGRGPARVRVPAPRRSSPTPARSGSPRCSSHRSPRGPRSPRAPRRAPACGSQLREGAAALRASLPVAARRGRRRRRERASTAPRPSCSSRSATGSA